LSPRVHSRYQRKLTDLPWQGRVVALRLLVRRFFCTSAACDRKIFAERLPDLAAAHARTTLRLGEAHGQIGLALGGEAGSRLAQHLAMPTSPDTLLRRVKNYPVRSGPLPRIVGIDDWAWRKGQRYGTILVDLERGRVLDLLPDRNGSTVQSWLKGQPQIEVVSRDRSATYAQAISAAAPQAQQVADRWHLLKNLRETVERLLDRHYARIQDVFRIADGVDPEISQPSLKAVSVPHVTPSLPLDAGPHSAQNAGRQQKRQRRRERFQRVRELHARGCSLRHIAGKLGIGKGTVLRYLRRPHCPDWKVGQPRRARLDGFVRYVDQRVQQGCRNATELFHELAAQGCDSSYDAVRRFLNRRLGAAGCKRLRANAATCPPPAPPSARKLSFDFIRRPEKRRPEQQRRLDRVRAADADLTATLDVAAEFAAMLRKQSGLALADWLAKAARTSSREIQAFAEGLRADEAAVTAGLKQPWSNGPVEGQVNRLKMIKRQMYGRAGFALLRARVLHAA
jgi:transposase